MNRNACNTFHIYYQFVAPKLRPVLPNPIYGIGKIGHGADVLLLPECFIFLRKIACDWLRCKVAAFCDRAEAKFQLSIANGSGGSARKRSKGWHPPRPAKVQHTRSVIYQ